MEMLSVPQGEFVLARDAGRDSGPLRAWDAADEMLLHHLAESEPAPDAETGMLIVNDQFGALGVALAACNPIIQTDSYMAHQAIRRNLRANGHPEDALELLSSLQSPTRPLRQVLMKVPKSLALLEDQLHRLRPFVTQQTSVVAAGMTRHIHNSTLQLFERLLGPTRTSRARKKARLILVQPDPDLHVGSNPFPKCYRLSEPRLQLCGHGGVYSHRRLDSGTGLLLPLIKASDRPAQIVDLACGNGVIGLVAALRNPHARVTLTDESFMAVASARANALLACGETARIECRVDDAMATAASDSADWVLNNPPFHQQHAVDDAIAWRMFTEARRVLRSGGEFWVVGNRHLAYHAKLKRVFGNCRNLASNPGFVVLAASKR